MAVSSCHYDSGNAQRLQGFQVSGRVLRAEVQVAADVARGFKLACLPHCLHLYLLKGGKARETDVEVFLD